MTMGCVMSLLRMFAVVTLLAISATQALAATLAWPGVTPCNTTLQACINGSASGDRIEIATNTAINEDITIFGKSLTLVPRLGYRPQLANGRLLTINSAITTADMAVTVTGLRLPNGGVNASYQGTGTANYVFRDLVADVGGFGSGGWLEVRLVAGTMNLDIRNSRFRCANDSFRYGMYLQTRPGTTLDARLLDNRVRCFDAVDYGGEAILILVDGGSGGASGSADVRLHGNEVLLGRIPDVPASGWRMQGIRIGEAGTPTTPNQIRARLFSNVVSSPEPGSTSEYAGIDLFLWDGNIDAVVLNNTVAGTTRGLSVYRYGEGTASGTVRNNLLQSTATALWIASAFAATVTNDYNLVNGSVTGVTAGANTITSPARLVSPGNPRLRPDSPAIDAADTSTLGLAILLSGGLPVLDADGLRRIKGATGNADIGAYEYGDFSFGHVAGTTNTTGHITTLDAAALNGQSTARAFANLWYPDPGGTTHASPWGVYYTASRWRIFDQASTTIPVNTRFSVFAPAPGAGLFTHSATGGGSYYTQLDSSSLNGLPNNIVLAEQNWSLGTTYNAHPIGVYYSSGTSRWFIDNIDQVTMPVGAGFNVYTQAPSPNAFVIESSSANTVADRFMLVDHPLLTGIACARPLATRVSLNPVSSQWRWMYSGGGWWLSSDDGGVGTLSPGTKFHVVVNPAQVAECLDRIFTNGFDS